MNLQIIKTGRFLYGMGITAVGIHQLLLQDFRPEILPPFPAWAHAHIVFAILTGIAFVFAGLMIAGLFSLQRLQTKTVCLWLGFFFLVVVIACHLPYILLLGPYKASRLDVWFGAGEALAYSGGAFVMAGSFPVQNFNGHNTNRPELLLEKVIPAGRILYSLLILLFGCSHFVFTAFVSAMVPKWMGFPLFWTYFVGVALVSAAIAIILKIWVKPVALLLAFMLLLFFIFFHVPDAMENPTSGKGNEIVRAIIALLFTGIALVIACTDKEKTARVTGG